MTRDEIVRMAQEAAIMPPNWGATENQWRTLHNFAALVAAAERKACEKIQFELRERYISQNKTAQAEIMLLTAVYDYAAEIQARGQA